MIQLTERRIDNAISAMNKFEQGTWGHSYWSRVVAHLLRSLNKQLNEKQLALPLVSRYH